MSKANSRCWWEEASSGWESGNSLPARKHAVSHRLCQKQGEREDHSDVNFWADWRLSASGDRMGRGGPSVCATFLVRSCFSIARPDEAIRFFGDGGNYVLINSNGPDLLSCDT